MGGQSGSEGAARASGGARGATPGPSLVRRAEGWRMRNAALPAGDRRPGPRRARGGVSRHRLGSPARPRRGGHRAHRRRWGGRCCTGARATGGPEHAPACQGRASVLRVDALARPVGPIGAHRRVDLAGLLRHEPLHDGDVALVDAAIGEGRVQAALHFGAACEQHQARGRHVEPVHDACIGPARRNPRAQAVLLALATPRHREHARGLVGDDQVVVFVPDPPLLHGSSIASAPQLPGRGSDRSGLESRRRAGTSARGP